MTALILLGVGLTLALFGALVVAIILLIGVSQDIQEVNTKADKLTSLSLNPRTRIAQASMQSGAVTPEQEGKRLAQASRGKRVVVGGDPDSEQHRQLSHGIREGETDGS